MRMIALNDVHDWLDILVSPLRRIGSVDGAVIGGDITSNAARRAALEEP